MLGEPFSSDVVGLQVEFLLLLIYFINKVAIQKKQNVVSIYWQYANDLTF